MSREPEPWGRIASGDQLEDARRTLEDGSSLTSDQLGDLFELAEEALAARESENRVEVAGAVPLDLAAVVAHIRAKAKQVNELERAEPDDVEGALLAAEWEALTTLADELERGLPSPWVSVEDPERPPFGEEVLGWPISRERPRREVVRFRDLGDGPVWHSDRLAEWGEAPLVLKWALLPAPPEEP